MKSTNALERMQESSIKNLSPYELGKQYVAGKLEISFPELESRVAECMRSNSVSPIRGRLPIVFHQLMQLVFNPQKGKGAFKIGERHYDLGNDLFVAMLDESMSYTCGLWEGVSSLAEAQTAKLERACKMLDLKPGMTVLDIGCGWGNFAHYASSNYGVKVTGLTVSKEQAEFARKRCSNLPVSIALEDYRTYSGQFDRIVSIEMIEAVGKKNIPVFFKKVNSCLRPEGRFLLQVISAETFSRYSNPTFDSFVAWIRENIFPDGYLPRMDEVIRPHRCGLWVSNIQSFGNDYAQTLRAWQQNFNQGWEDLSAQYPEEFRRMWNFYLAGCAAVFSLKHLDLYQVTYQKA